jgi:hypothetical protein
MRPTRFELATFGLKGHAESEHRPPWERDLRDLEAEGTVKGTETNPKFSEERKLASWDGRTAEWRLSRGRSGSRSKWMDFTSNEGHSPVDGTSTACLAAES